MSFCKKSLKTNRNT